MKQSVFAYNGESVDVSKQCLSGPGSKSHQKNTTCVSAINLKDCEGLTVMLNDTSFVNDLGQAVMLSHALVLQALCER